MLPPLVVSHVHVAIEHPRVQQSALLHYPSSSLLQLIPPPYQLLVNTDRVRVPVSVGVGQKCGKKEKRAYKSQLSTQRVVKTSGQQRQVTNMRVLTASKENKERNLPNPSSVLIGRLWSRFFLARICLLAPRACSINITITGLVRLGLLRIIVIMVSITIIRITTICLAA